MTKPKVNRMNLYTFKTSLNKHDTLKWFMPQEPRLKHEGDTHRLGTIVGINSGCDMCLYESITFSPNLQQLTLFVTHLADDCYKTKNK